MRSLNVTDEIFTLEELINEIEDHIMWVNYKIGAKPTKRLIACFASIYINPVISYLIKICLGKVRLREIALLCYFIYLQKLGLV